MDDGLPPVRPGMLRVRFGLHEPPLLVQLGDYFPAVLLTRYDALRETLLLVFTSGLITAPAFDEGCQRLLARLHAEDAFLRERDGQTSGPPHLRIVGDGAATRHGKT
jgi:hypothetical protein